jgi:hypothetical protein
LGVCCGPNSATQPRKAPLPLSTPSRAGPLWHKGWLAHVQHGAETSAAQASEPFSTSNVGWHHHTVRLASERCNHHQQQRLDSNDVRGGDQKDSSPALRKMRILACAWLRQLASKWQGVDKAICIPCHTAASVLLQRATLECQCTVATCHTKPNQVQFEGDKAR